MMTEDIIETSPMSVFDTRPSRNKPIPIRGYDALLALPHARDGRFADRQHASMIWMFCAPGVPCCSGRTGLKLTDVDMNQDVAFVRGMADRTRQHRSNRIPDKL
jgi:hypothetical protein